MEDLLRRMSRNIAAEHSMPAQSRIACSPDFLNAYGVSLLRQMKIYEALTVFNEISLDPTSLRVRRDVPDSFKINLATARLLAKNPRGCLEALRMVRNPKSETCRRLRMALRQWDRSLPPLWRLAWRIGLPPKTLARLDFAPGELNG